MGKVSKFIQFSTPESLGWEVRYDGLLAVASIQGVAVAGISGPWPDGNFVLTWWSTRETEVAPTMEFHPSMHSARARVEEVTASLVPQAA